MVPIVNHRDWNYHGDTEALRELSMPSVSAVADLDVGHASACPSQRNSLTADVVNYDLR
jgi:hypothetical protein